MTLDVRSGVLVTMASGTYGYEDRFLEENKCLYSESYHSPNLLEDSLIACVAAEVVLAMT